MQHQIVKSVGHRVNCINWKIFLRELLKIVIHSKGKYFVQPKYKEFPDKSFAEVSFFVIRELPSSQVEAAMPKYKLLLFSSLVELDHTLEITLLW